MALILVYSTLLAFVPYFIAVWRAPRLNWERWRGVIVAVAVLARLIMLPVPTVLSADVYRYCWEGKVLNAGYNPYRLAPNAPELAGLRDADWEKLTHREVACVYPPLLLQLFRIARQPVAFKVIFTAFDLATIGLLIKLLQARGQNKSLSLIWAWNPLVILEFAGNAHEMSLAIFFFVAGLLFWERNRQALTGVALAGAALSHLLAVPMALAVVARKWRAAIPFVLLACVGFVEMPGLVHLAGRWRFNGSLFEVLVSLFGDETVHRVGEIWFVYVWPKRVAAILIVAVIGWTIVRRYRVSLAALIVAGAVLLLSSTVHPWYVTWLVALACVEFSLPWLAFSAFVLVSYVARIVELETGVWVDAEMVRWLEYAPLFGLLLVDSLRRRQ